MVAFFGINASTADGVKEDQTTRKWNGFSQLNGFGRYIVGNPFDYIATDVNDLASFMSPEIPRSRQNNRYLRQIIDEAEILIPCWGNLAKIPKRLRPVVDQLKRDIFSAGKPVLIFGLTQAGDPKHPLMLPYSTKLVEWRP